MSEIKGLTAEQLIEEINKIDNNIDINSRAYEDTIREISKKIGKMDDKYANEIDKYINQHKDDTLGFGMFYAYYSYCRKLSILPGEDVKTLTELVKKYEGYFKGIDIFKFLLQMAIVKDGASNAELIIAREEIDELIKSKKFKDKDLVGIKNFYTEIVCEYYERNVEEIYDNSQDFNKYINKALSYIEDAIRLEDKYFKFSVNKARAYILTKDYEDAERMFRYAIHNAKDDYDRLLFASFYNTSKTVKSIIEMHEQINDKTKNLKIDNAKVITLITTLLGFILGDIQIFTKAESTQRMCWLMAAHGSVLIVLLSIVLFSMNLLFTNKSNTKNGNILRYLGDILLFAIGITMFLLVVFIALK